MLQFLLSFGHMHLDGIAGAASHGVIAGAHKITIVQNSGQAPAQNQSDNDYCAICASIFLVSTSFVSEPPKLPVPLGFERIEHAFNVTAGPATPRLLAFQSRAPPAA